MPGIFDALDQLDQAPQEAAPQSPGIFGALDKLPDLTDEERKQDSARDRAARWMWDRASRERKEALPEMWGAGRGDQAEDLAYASRIRRPEDQGVFNGQQVGVERAREMARQRDFSQENPGVDYSQFKPAFDKFNSELGYQYGRAWKQGVTGSGNERISDDYLEQSNASDQQKQLERQAVAEVNFQHDRPRLVKDFIRDRMLPGNYEPTKEELINHARMNAKGDEAAGVGKLYGTINAPIITNTAQGLMKAAAGLTNLVVDDQGATADILGRTDVGTQRAAIEEYGAAGPAIAGAARTAGSLIPAAAAGGLARGAGALYGAGEGQGAALIPGAAEAAAGEWGQAGSLGAFVASDYGENLSEAKKQGMSGASAHLYAASKAGITAAVMAGAHGAFGKELAGLMENVSADTINATTKSVLKSMPASVSRVVGEIDAMSLGHEIVDQIAQNRGDLSDLGRVLKDATIQGIAMGVVTHGAPLPKTVLSDINDFIQEGKRDAFWATAKQRLIDQKTRENAAIGKQGLSAEDLAPILTLPEAHGGRAINKPPAPLMPPAKEEAGEPTFQLKDPTDARQIARWVYENPHEAARFVESGKIDQGRVSRLPNTDFNMPDRDGRQALRDAIANEIISKQNHPALNRPMLPGDQAAQPAHPPDIKLTPDKFANPVLSEPEAQPAPQQAPAVQSNQAPAPQAGPEAAARAADEARVSQMGATELKAEARRLGAKGGLRKSDALRQQVVQLLAEERATQPPPGTVPIQSIAKEQPNAAPARQQSVSNQPQYLGTDTPRNAETAPPPDSRNSAVGSTTNSQPEQAQANVGPAQIESQREAQEGAQAAPIRARTDVLAEAEKLGIPYSKFHSTKRIEARIAEAKATGADTGNVRQPHEPPALSGKSEQAVRSNHEEHENIPDRVGPAQETTLDSEDRTAKEIPGPTADVTAKDTPTREQNGATTLGREEVNIKKGLKSESAKREIAISERKQQIEAARARGDITDEQAETLHRAIDNYQPREPAPPQKPILAPSIPKKISLGEPGGLSPEETAPLNRAVTEHDYKAWSDYRKQAGYDKIIPRGQEGWDSPENQREFNLKEKDEQYQKLEARARKWDAEAVDKEMRGASAYDKASVRDYLQETVKKKGLSKTGAEVKRYTAFRISTDDLLSMAHDLVNQSRKEPASLDEVKQMVERLPGTFSSSKQFGIPGADMELRNRLVNFLVENKWNPPEPQEVKIPTEPRGDKQASDLEIARTIDYRDYGIPKGEWKAIRRQLESPDADQQQLGSVALHGYINRATPGLTSEPDVIGTTTAGGRKTRNNADEALAMAPQPGEMAAVSTKSLQRLAKAGNSHPAVQAIINAGQNLTKPAIRAMSRALSDEARDYHDYFQGKKVTSIISADRAFRDISNEIARMDPQDRLDLHRAYQQGVSTGNKEFDGLFDNMRQLMLADAREVERVTRKDGKPGLLANPDPNYTKGLYKNRNGELAIAGRNPLEGPAGFRYAKHFKTVDEAIQNRYTPLDNVIEMNLMAHEEMQRYVAIHDTVNTLRELGSSIWVPLRATAPPGFKKGLDKIFNPLAPNTHEVRMAYDKLMSESLDKAFAANGVKENELPADSKKIGYSKSSGEVSVRYTSPLSARTHELFHKIDGQVGLAKQVMSRRGNTSQTTMEKEMSDLAAQRHAGSVPTQAFKDYVQTDPEKAAVMGEAYVHAPELMKQVAPHVHDALDQVLSSNPALQTIKDVKPSLTIEDTVRQYTEHGGVVHGAWYLPEQYARYLENYASKSLAQHARDFGDGLGVGGAAESAVKSAAWFNGLARMSRLWGWFHAKTAAALSFGSSIGTMGMQAETGLHQIARGDWSGVESTGGRMAKSLLGLIPGVKAYRGVMIGKEMMEPGSTAYGSEAAAATLGGERLDRMPRQTAKWRLERSLRDLRDDGGVGNLARVLGNGVSRAFEWSMTPAMAYARVARRATVAEQIMERMVQLGPNATLPERMRAANDISRMGEEIFGQVAYDKYNYSRATIEAGQNLVQSLGWTAGSLKLAGHGLVDVAGAPKRGLKGDYVLTPRMANLMGGALAAAVVGGLYQKWKTGEYPQNFKDAFLPRTGLTRPDGSPDRVSLMPYVSDFYGYSKTPLDTIANKLSPGAQYLTQAVTGKNYFGSTVVRHDENFIPDMGKNLIRTFEPFNVRNARQGFREGAGWGQAVESALGVTPVSGALSRSPAMAEAMSHSTPNQRRLDQQEDLQVQHALIAKAKREGGLPGLQKYLDSEVAAGRVSQRSARATMKYAGEEPLTAKTERIENFGDKLSVLEKADKQERTPAFMGMMHRGLGAALESTPRNELPALLDRARSSGLDTTIARTAFQSGDPDDLHAAHRAYQIKALEMSGDQEKADKERAAIQKEAQRPRPSGLRKKAWESARAAAAYLP